MSFKIIFTNFHKILNNNEDTQTSSASTANSHSGARHASAGEQPAALAAHGVRAPGRHGVARGDAGRDARLDVLFSAFKGVLVLR